MEAPEWRQVPVNSTPREFDMPPTSRLRADAQRNRKRIIDAANEVFGEHGIDARTDEIARKAKVGVGTVYRHFPTKEALVFALLEARLERLIAEAAAALDQETDAWSALERFVRFSAEAQFADRSLAELVGGHLVLSRQLRARVSDLFGLLTEIVAGAKRSGELRADVEATDVRIAIGAMAHLAWAGSPCAKRALERYLGLLFDGLRAPARHGLEGTPLTIEDVESIFGLPGTPAPQTTRAFTPGRRRRRR